MTDNEKMALLLESNGKKEVAKIETYHETLGGAVQAIKDYLEKKQVVPVNDAGQPSDEWLEIFTYDGIKYPEKGASELNHKEAHSAITVKGKPSKKWIHATIWRHDNGKYEVNVYAL